VATADTKNEMNPLRQYFEENPGRLIHKWVHYFDIYHRHLARFRNEAVTLVEFGVYHGGSLQMWKRYFGPRVQIVGVDINPACKSLEEDQVQIYIGDQEDRAFLRALCSELGRFDIVIDDGGHTMRQQIVTFEEMFPHLAAPGAYLAEDLHTSYWGEYGDRYKKPKLVSLRRPPTFIEYSKNLIDAMNAWHSRDPGELAITDFTRTAASMHYYDSVLVIEKGAVDRPHDRMTGSPSFPPTS